MAPGVRGEARQLVPGIGGREGLDIKCRFANARPEPDFRYFSKTAALDSDANSIEATSRHGLNVAVCWDPPLL